MVHPLAPVLAQIARLASGVTTRWVDCPPSERQRIYYANHTSHLDFVVLWSSLPSYLRRLTRPVAAEDYWDASVLRRYLACRVFRAMLIPRGTANGAPAAERTTRARDVIGSIVADLGKRDSLIIFPEGTRGSGASVAPFKSGLYYLCRARPDLELVPAWIQNLNRVLPKGEVLMVPVLSAITFGPPFRIGDGESKQEFLTRARDALCRLAPS